MGAKLVARGQHLFRDLPAVIAAEEGRVGAFARRIRRKGVREAVHAQGAAVGERVVPAGNDVGVERFGLLTRLEAHVGVAGGVDDGFACRRKPAAFVFEDQMRDGTVGTGGCAEPRVVEDLNARIAQQLFVGQNDGVRIEARFEAPGGTRFGRGRRVAPRFGDVLEQGFRTLFLQIVHREAQQLLGNAREHLPTAAVAQGQINRDVADRRQTAQRAEALRQQNGDAGPGCGQRRGNPRNAAAHDNDVPCTHNRQGTGRFRKE